MYAKLDLHWAGIPVVKTEHDDHSGYAGTAA